MSLQKAPRLQRSKDSVTSGPISCFDDLPLLAYDLPFKVSWPSWPPGPKHKGSCAPITRTPLGRTLSLAARDRGQQRDSSGPERSVSRQRKAPPPEEMCRVRVEGQHGFGRCRVRRRYGPTRLAAALSMQRLAFPFSDACALSISASIFWPQFGMYFFPGLWLILLSALRESLPSRISLESVSSTFTLLITIASQKGSYSSGSFPEMS